MKLNNYLIRLAGSQVGTHIATITSKMLIQVITTPGASEHAPDQVRGAADSKPSPPSKRTAASTALAQTALQSAFNHASPIPLYSQIRELLRVRILDGTYRGDAQIPSENEMVKTFGVSRITVRQALNDLQKEGLIFKIHGKGTFVSRPKAVQNLMRIEGFGEAMSAAGHETHSRVLGYRVMRPGHYVAARLGISDDVDVMEIRRVRYLDRDPISLDVTYVSVDLGRRLVKEDLPQRDIFAILEHDYGLQLECAELRIDATLADHALAETLAINEGGPVLRIERLTFATPGQPIDFEYLYYRGDAFQYFMMVGRRDANHARAAVSSNAFQTKRK